MKCYLMGWGWGIGQNSLQWFWRSTELLGLELWMDFPWTSNTGGKLGFREMFGDVWRCLKMFFIPEDKKFCTSSGLSQSSFTTAGHVLLPPEPLQLYPRIMKLILLKLNLPSINYPPESLNHFWTELNSFHLLFPWFISHLAAEMQNTISSG